MTRSISKHIERHLVARIGWMRAAVLGANDGIVSTASLIVGVAAAGATKADIITAGIAGLVAGAMSMAAGEYVSVSSQADTESADLLREAAELKNTPELELQELTTIYAARGVELALAKQIAQQMMTKDALGAHARDELGISEITVARPVQAAITSAITFASGAALPLLAAMLAPLNAIVPAISVATIGFLALLGALSARAGGTKLFKPLVRVVFWGALALGVTASIGRLFGTVV